MLHILLFTLKKKNGFYVSIHEANLVNYSSMTLAPKGDGLLEAELYPDGQMELKLNLILILLLLGEQFKLRIIALIFYYQT